MLYKNLIESAFETQKNAISTYSNFNVGAALLTGSNKIYCGFNIEVCTPLGICAERVALTRALFDGEKTFKAIAVVGKSQTASNFDYCPPCGTCRQFLREFCKPNEFKIILAKSLDEYKIFTLEELLPNSFGPEFI